MNELEFKHWLAKEQYSKKIISDTVSRLKKIERINNYIDLDDEYALDQCVRLLSTFRNKGQNEEMNKLDSSSLPIGKYQLSTYKYAINLYIRYLESLT